MSKFIFIPALRDFKHIPPTVSFANYLASNNNKVIIFSFHTEIEIFNSKVEVINISTRPYPKAFFMRIFQKAWSYITFFWFLHKHIKEIDLIFLGAWDFKMLKVFCKIFGLKGKIAFQFHELEFNKLKYCRAADYCIIPEENRLWITYFHGKLKRKPMLLPNIPYIESFKPSMVPEIINILKSKNFKLLLYQGLIDFNKRCIGEILEALKETNNDIHLLIMPSYVSPLSEIKKIKEKIKLLKIDERVHLIDSRPTPEHLTIVRNVDAGIGLYKPVSLNHIYAAPNRLYEFTCFGIPVILPDFPSFKALALKYPFGINIANPESITSISNAISELFKQDNLIRGRDNARRFFTDNGNYEKWAERVWKEIKAEL